MQLERYEELRVQLTLARNFHCAVQMNAYRKIKDTHTKLKEAISIAKATPRKFSLNRCDGTPFVPGERIGVKLASDSTGSKKLVQFFRNFGHNAGSMTMVYEAEVNATIPLLRAVQLHGNASNERALLINIAK
jgi:hypothetical protein